VLSQRRQRLKNGIILLLVFLSIAPWALGYTVKKNAPDIESEDFEKGIPSSFLMGGYPAGQPAASLKSADAAGESFRGNHSLSFDYSRGNGPVPVIFHNVLLKDFQTIDFWIKAEQRTKWVLTFTDLDHAEFSTLVDIRPGYWKHVILRPGDFRCNKDSPVRKNRVDVSRLGFGYTSFDFLAIGGGSGKNRVWIDDLAIERSPIDIVAGDYIISSTRSYITSSTRIRGNLVLTNGSELSVNADRFQIDGDILVKNSKLILSSGLWIFHQDYRYHHHLWAQKQGQVEMHNGYLYMYQPYSAGVSNTAGLLLRNVKVLGGLFTLGLQKGGSLTVDRCINFGEVIIDEGSDISVSDCESILLWLNCGRGLKTRVSFPGNNVKGVWNSPSSLKRTLKVENSKDVLWGLIASNGCDITIQGSVLRAVGVLYHGKVGAVVRNMKNEAHFRDFTYQSPYHELRFIDTQIKTWNFYTSGAAVLNIHDCTYGESISFGRSQINVFDSVCDGSGGYIGARDDSTTNFYGGEIVCNVLTHDRAQFLIQDCLLVRGRVEASGQSKITVINTPMSGAAREIDQGKIFIKN
jgi:hypothetical protein